MEEYTSKRLMEEVTRDRYQEYFRLTGNEAMIKAAVGRQYAISEDTEKKSLRKIQHPILTLKKKISKNISIRENFPNLKGLSPQNQLWMS